MKIPSISVTKSYRITHPDGGWLLQEMPSGKWVCHSASEKYFRERLKALDVPFITNADGWLCVPDTPEPAPATPPVVPPVLELELDAPALTVTELPHSCCAVCSHKKERAKVVRKRFYDAHRTELMEKNKIYKASPEYKEKQREYARRKYHENVEKERARSRAYSARLRAAAAAAAST